MNNNKFSHIMNNNLLLTVVLTVVSTYGGNHYKLLLSGEVSGVHSCPPGVMADGSAQGRRELLNESTPSRLDLCVGASRALQHETSPY